MINRIGTLEQKEDEDTVYDDTEIKKELSQLNESIAKKKLYYAYAYEKDGANGFTKYDVYDSFYREISNYFGISEMLMKKTVRMDLPSMMYMIHFIAKYLIILEYQKKTATMLMIIFGCLQGWLQMMS